MIAKISLILPVYNEEKIIGKVLNDVLIFSQKRFKQYEIIVVDDGSCDRSAVIIKEIMRSNPNVRFVQHKENRGYGSALRSGFKSALFDYIFFMDADGQFKIQNLDLIVPYIKDYDMVISYRQNRHDPVYRTALGFLFTKVINLYFGLNFKDVNCAYKLLKRQDINDFDLKIDGPLINAEILIKSQKNGLRIKEYPIPHYPRLCGQSTGAKVLTIIRAFTEFFYLIRIV